MQFSLFFCFVNERCSLLRRLVPFLLVFIVGKSDAQGNLLDYIDLGLSSNLVLQQKSLSYEKAMAALEEAQTYRKINVNLLPTYTLAAGGRTIDIPVGNLLNPVYQSLNQLTASSSFPEIENVQELLNPNNFYDLKVQLTYPIFNKDIKLNEQIKSLQGSIAQKEIVVYKQELKKEIALAYLDCQKAITAITVYEEVSLLIQESIRVNKGLYDNGKVNRTVVLRSENDLQNNQVKINEARITAKKAMAYLNFLVNRDLEAEVILDTSIKELPSIMGLEGSINNREELRQLENLSAINRTATELANSTKRPKVNAFVDLGMQDFDFNVDENSFYVFGGVSMSLNLFDGGRTEAKIKQTNLETNNVLIQIEDLRKKLELAAFTARRSYEIATNNYSIELENIQLNQRIYSENARLYQNGKLSYIDLESSRNELTISKINESISFFEVWKKWYELQRVYGK